MAPLLRTTASLVGLVICESPHEGLTMLYTRILDVLEQISENAAYSTYAEQITNEKLGLVKVEPDVKKLEDQLQSGQLAEGMLEAANEVSLAGKMIHWKPWEPLAEELPAISGNDQCSHH
ncbi:NADH dehydrogenase [ubiquinone] 1 alpha subcomplex subunit 5-like [Lontra canadensis]|uniref:NADH dehydrogenase [ubiquinone] 1 alpha subcomplex subunit 5-like n=1 Tax=Lontra canadensis TaxID=76717 RepID=UPI0013F38451|nr:NADH dehydrogenase [ubiquinone] 1 alpha subcomplex subunit 5-like [Lontra canadensis]